MRLSDQFTRAYFAACRDVLGAARLQALLYETNRPAWIQKPPRYITVQVFVDLNHGIEVIAGDIHTGAALNRQIGIAFAEHYADPVSDLSAVQVQFERITDMLIEDGLVTLTQCPVCRDLYPDPTRQQGFCSFFSGYLLGAVTGLREVEEVSCWALGDEYCTFQCG